MAKRATKTGFDKLFEEKMRSPSFAKAYVEARAEVDTIDRIVREIDEVRQAQDITKTALAHAAGMRPEIVRRLFTAEEPNPTLETIVRVMAALGRTLAVVPMPRTRLTQRSAVRVRDTRLRVAARPRSRRLIASS